MSFVISHPEALAMTASDLNSVEFALAAPNMAVAAAATGLPPAAADDISALAATQFSAYAVSSQAVSDQALAVHRSFAAVLGASATWYAASEAANTIPTM